MNALGPVLLPLPIMLALMGAGLTLALGAHPRAQRLVSGGTLTLVVAVAGFIMAVVDRQGPIVTQLGGWLPPAGIVLVADRLSALMLLVSTVVTLGVALYSMTGYHEPEVEDDEDESPLPVFHPALLLLSAGVSITFLTGDLFNLYVGFEVLLFASFVLLTLGGTRSRVRAGITYVLVSLLSSVVFLVSIAMIYAATGTVNLAHLATRLPLLSHEAARTLHVLLLIGFAAKAAIFPMSSWLPDSYPTAPAPVTAVFAGLLTKVGVYTIFRTETLLFPDGSATTVLQVAAVLTMVVGALGAISQDDLKRVLSFTLVSHIGYMVFGLTMGSVAGLSAAVFYTAHHIIVQTTLFLVAGLIERRAGTSSLVRLGGLLRSAPLLAVLFLIPGLNLGGIPPFSGFLGKVGLIQAGVAEGSPMAWVLVVTSVLTSLLTLYAINRVWSRAFWRAAPTDVTVKVRERRLERGLLAPAVAMVILTVLLTAIAGPLYGLADRAAQGMLSDSYVEHVFPGGRP